MPVSKYYEFIDVILQSVDVYSQETLSVKRL